MELALARHWNPIYQEYLVSNGIEFGKTVAFWSSSRIINTTHYQSNSKLHQFRDISFEIKNLDDFLDLGPFVT